MSKTLVTIGYHYGELNWGKEVKNAYENRQLIGNRNLCFYEVTKSQIETGDPCQIANQEIEKMLKEYQFNVWIDIHCFVSSINSEKYRYRSNNEDNLSQAQLIPEIEISNINNIPLEHRTGIFPNSALADPYFTKDDFKYKTKRYNSALERTLLFINQIHDIHIPSKQKCLI